MENYVSAMPLWAIILFIVSFLISLIPMANTAKQAALNAGMSNSKSRNIQLGILIFYILWLAYASILALKGVFTVNTLPPRVFLFTSIPLMIILFIIIGNTGLYKKLIHAASLESLIRIHVFRVVGIFFLLLYFNKLLPTNFAFSADMGDLITAIFAIPVARAVSQKKSWSIKAVYAWNIFGILDIVVLTIFAVIIALSDAKTGGNSIKEMGIFPFVWFPAFAPATILFLHSGVFRKLKQLRTRQV